MLRSTKSRYAGKKQLLKKLKTFIVTAMMFSASVNAQVIYTDVIPDRIIDSTNSVYPLDLNNDGIIDYNINFTTGIISGSCNLSMSYSSTAYYITITPLDSNEVGTDATSPFYPKALLLDSLIDSAAFTWKNTSSQLLAEKLWHCITFNFRNYWVPYYVGNWNNASNKYLPLRLKMGSQVYYGWVRISIATGVTNATIFDYAYNSIPDSAILAGQTTATGIIENSFASSINLFPNPANNHLTIALGSNNKIVQVTIADITGKVIYTTIATDTQKVEVNTKDFAEGIYVVQIQAAGFIGTKKLVVEK